MRMLRLFLAGTVILGLLTSLSVAVVARDEADPMAPAYFTFTQGSPVGPTDGGDTYCDGNTCEARGMVAFGIPVEASDRRASGVLAFAQNSDNFFYDHDAIAIHTVTTSMRLVNDGGAWSGTGRGTRSLGDDALRATESTVLTGEGGYEGLTLILNQHHWDDDGQMHWGVIIPADRMPPVPDLIEPPAE